MRRLATAVAAGCVVALVLAGAALLVVDDDATTAAPGMVVPAQDGQASRVLREGNVILVAGRGRVEEARRLARDLAGGADTQDLRAEGRAVVVRPGPGDGGIVAVAWRHQQRAERADEPELAAFVEYWLGRGA